ncbi:MAG: toll/interleukin-1 receptor domain-containing protein [Pseudomonadota bacterium]
MATDCKYKAFISYDVSDEKWARWLHRSLEAYKPPKRLVGTVTDKGVVPSVVTPVFRARGELNGSVELAADSIAALEDSACLVVICSMASARSVRVNQEILTFKRLGKSNRVFSLIVDGEPYASGSPESDQFECFPEALRYQLGEDGELSSVTAEPIAADARPGKDGKNHAKIKLLAGMLGVGFDDLRQRELHRRQRRMAALSSAAVTGMIIAIGLATTAIIARNEADVQRDRAEQEAETAKLTADFMIGLFQVSDPSEARGRTITAREILVKGADRIEQDLQAEPAIQASLMTTMGEVFNGLGLHDDASDLLELALVRRRVLTPLSEADLTDSIHELAKVKLLQRSYTEAEPLLLEAVERLVEEGDEQALIDANIALVQLYEQTNRYNLAQETRREVIRLQGLAPD